MIRVIIKHFIEQLSCRIKKGWGITFDFSSVDVIDIAAISIIVAICSSCNGSFYSGLNR